MAIPPPPITPVPTPAPQRGDRATFSDRVDAFVTWLEAATAEFEAVAQNTYENATIAEGSGDVASVGLGITSAAPFMPNIDNAAIAAGFWYVDNTTLGTFPSVGALSGLMIHKVYGDEGFQLYQPASLDRVFYRRRVGSAWQTWNEFAKSGVNTDITQLNALQHIGMAHTSPSIDFDETDQAGAAGLWRMTFQGDAWNFVKNTAAGGDFSTSVSMLSADFAGTVKVNGAAPVQQGTGVGQSAGDLIKLGWGSSGGGLRFTLNTTDQGYIPISSTNPAAGAITFPNNIIAGKYQTTGNVGVVASVAQYGYSATAGAQIIGYGSIADVTIYDRNGVSRLETNLTNVGVQNGTLSTLGGGGYFQIGLSNSLNIVQDYTNIQARNNGAATTLNLNSLGGQVQVGAGGLNANGSVTANSLVANNGLQLKDPVSTIKLQMMQGATTRGFIGADAGNCFIAINAANSLAALSADNSGNVTAAGNITANSDERLKKDWADLPEDFLYRLARAKHGTYTRIDNGERQAGASAQDFQAMLPEVVPVHPETGVLSLAYGNVALLAAIKLAQQVEQLQAEIDELKGKLA